MQTISVENYNDGDDESFQLPACLQCRKRKQKCSRGDPCQSCLTSGSVCLYEENKRRGPRAGHIEALTSRMDTLEAIVLGQTMLLSPQLASQRRLSSADHAVGALHVQQSGNGKRISGSSLQEQLDITRDYILNPRKRPRSSNSEVRVGKEEPESILPPEDLLHGLCQIYFTQIHPWIPILHRPNFEKALVSENKPSPVILKAITAATIKYSDVSAETQAWYYNKCRDAVVLAVMDLFSVESMQASIIIAYDTIGSGKGPRSWSIVASATRVVEQLGLAGEEEDVANNKLLNRIGFLTPSTSWTESEERRRVFWTIFLMDRFCSVTTGWNTSLTSTDVKRRLPVEGTFWRDDEPRTARYFNISEQIVDSIDETSALGGFAYLIEASECLKRVVSFLLHEEADFSDSNGLRRWFDIFQGLDAMLVRWKTFLPERWQVACVDGSGHPDQNLTLAHITHNTSVILLHQNIAYPDASLSLRLPRESATQTCVAAATEIATISTKFLLHTQTSVSPQFTFCLFVAARALLAHSIYYNTALSSNFAGFIASLHDLSRRWNGNGPQEENLAAQFADRLETAMHANSPISVRVAALDGGFSMSLASPPFPDIFRSGPVAYDVANGDGEIDIAAGSQDFDRIFAWADDPSFTS
jgi:hypothetical protein